MSRKKMGKSDRFRKMSKSDATEPSDIVITDEIRMSALKNELEYWKVKYILLEKYGNR